MLAKFTASFILLAVGIAQVTAQAQAGVFRIINQASNSSLRATSVGATIFVSSTREVPGDNELWRINPNSAHVTRITNLGLNADAAAVDQEGRPVTTSHQGTDFLITPAGGDNFLIQIPNQDLVWNAEPPVVPRGNVALRRQNGASSQRWRLEPRN